MRCSSDAIRAMPDPTQLANQDRISPLSCTAVAGRFRCECIYDVEDAPCIQGVVCEDPSLFASDQICGEHGSEVVGQAHR